MKTAEELRNALASFYGTEEWHRLRHDSTVTVTDGVKYVMDECSARWMPELIVDMQRLPEVAR